MLLGSASAAFLLIREIRVAKNRLFPEGKIYIFFEFCTQFLANPSLDPNCSDYESSVCVQERGSLPLNGDFVLPQLLARTPRQRQGTGATSSASSQPSAGLCQIHSCPGSSYRHPNLHGALPREARGLNRNENHLCSSAERRLAEPETRTQRREPKQRQEREEQLTDPLFQVRSLTGGGSGQDTWVPEARLEQAADDKEEEDGRDDGDGQGQVAGKEGTAAKKEKSSVKNHPHGTGHQLSH